MKGFFITGTDTNIGKTVISSWLLAHMQAHSYCYWKPVQTGEERDSDHVRILTQDKIFVAPETYHFSAPLSPHAAAKRDQKHLILKNITPPPQPQREHFWIVEGAGGAMVPLNDTEYMSDLMLHLALPVILVVRGTLGTLNHSLLTIFYLKARNIPIAGIVINGALLEGNKEALCHYGNIPMLGHLPTLDRLDHQHLLHHPLPSSLKNILQKGQL